MAATPNAALKFEDLDFQPHAIWPGVEARNYKALIAADVLAEEAA